MPDLTREEIRERRTRAAADLARDKAGAYDDSALARIREWMFEIALCDAALRGLCPDCDGTGETETHGFDAGGGEHFGAEPCERCNAEARAERLEGLAKEWNSLRPIVQVMALEMERRFRANDHKNGGFIDHPSTWFLPAKLNEEVCELLAEPGLHEAADVANVAAIIACAYGVDGNVLPHWADRVDDEALRKEGE